MSDFQVNFDDLKMFRVNLKRADANYEKGKKKLLKTIGVHVVGLARKYAPESPIKRDSAKQNKSGRTRRKSTGVTSGSLRDSIIFQVGKNFVSIFVPSNSRGGGYAEKMENEKGKTWHDVGPRTKQKGSKAGDQYIARAARDSGKKINELVDHTLAKLTRDIGV